MSVNDLSRLYSITKGMDLNKIQSVGLADSPNNYVTTGMVSGQSVVYPRAGIFDYSEIQSYVRNTLKDGYLAKENANVAVLNGTNMAGLATDKANVLKSYGYNVGTVADAPTKDYETTQVIDLTGGKKPYTANYLKTRFNVKSVKTSLPNGVSKPQNADFVIILGQDETASS
jgi:hypothetical protein